MHTLDDFLNLLFEDLTGYVYAPLMSAEVDPLTKQRDVEQKFFVWPQEKEPLKEWITSSSETGNIYVSPVIYKEADSHKKFAKASNVVWVEYDGENIPDLSGLPEPDCIIQSSTLSHQHIYWKVDSGLSVDEIEGINRRVSHHLGADHGWAINKVLRPPETRNHKYPGVYTSILHFSPNGRKALGAFNEAQDKTSKPTVKEITKIPEADEILAKNSLSVSTIKMVTQDIPAGDRSGFLMKLGYILAEEGLREAEILSLLFVADERVGKFRGREDQTLRLTEIATLSWQKINADDEGLMVYSPVEIIDFKEEIEWYIRDWLHSRGGLILSGPPGIGKTQMALQLAYALSTGTSFLGKLPVNPLSVLFVSLEMEIMELKYIYKRQFEIFKENKADWDTNFKTIAPDGDFGTAGLDYVMDELKPDVVIIDSLSELAGEDLKEAEARRVMKWFKRARKHHNVAIIIIHHNRKASDSNKKPRTLDDLYGSFWFGKAPDTVIGLWREDEEKPIDVDSLKVRFGAKTRIQVNRDSETLTYTIVEGKTDDNRSGEYIPPKRGLGFS